MIPTHNPMLTSLFGTKAQVSQSPFAVQAGPSQAAQATPPHPSRADAQTTSEGRAGEAAGMGGTGSPTYRAAMAKALAVEAREAERLQGDIERGYRIRNDDNLRMKHAAALGTPAGEGTFASRADALDMASQFAGRTQSIINHRASDQHVLDLMTERLADPEKWHTTTKDIETSIARTKDSLAANRLNIDIQAAHLRRGFSVTAPTYAEAADGTLSHAAYEVRHSQYGLLVSIDANGIVTKHGPDGETERPQGQKVDKVV